MSFFNNPKEMLELLSEEERKNIDLIMQEGLEKHEDKAINKVIENKIIINLINFHYGLQKEKIATFREKIQKLSNKKEGLLLFKKMTAIIFSTNYNDVLVSSKDENLREIEKLILKGANVKGKLGTDLLIYCLKKYFYDTCALLIKAGVEIEKNDNTMSPVLKYCIEKERITFLELLLGIGIDLNREDTNGKSVLDLAKETNNNSLIEVLYLNGVKNEITNKIDEVDISKKRK